MLEQTGARMLVAPCPSGGNDPLAHLSLKDCALYRQNSAKVSLWNDVELQYDLQRARVEITIGQSSILLALPGCEVTTVERPGVLITSTALPDLQGTAPVTLVSGNKPRGGAAVAALSLRGAEAYATGGAGDLSVFTRGRNDFTVRRLSHAGT